MKHILAVLLVLAFTCLYAQPLQNNYLVNTTLYTQEHGLPSAEVYCGVQDQRGFLWFGTRSGLCRFDGKNFNVVAYRSGELKTYKIESLVADDSAGIIITYANTIAHNSRRKREVIDVNTFKISSLSQYYPGLPFADSSIIAVYKTHQQALGFIVDGPGRVWHFRSQTGFKQMYRGNQSLNKWPVRGYNISNVFDRPGFLFIGWTSLKMLLVNADTVYSMPGNRYQPLAPAKDGSLIYGFDSLDPKRSYTYLLRANGQLEPRTVFGSQNLKYRAGDLSVARACSNDNSSIFQFTDNSTLLFDSGGGTLNISESVTSHSITPLINGYFKDNNGLYWLCTSKGLIKLNLTTKKFRAHYNNTAQFHTANHSVRGIYANRQRFCANLYDMIVVQSNTDTLCLPFKSNYGLLVSDSGMWCGSFELRYHDFKTRQTRLKRTSLNNEIWSLYQLPNRKIYLGCTGNIDLYDPTSNLISALSNTNYPTPTFTYRIFKNPNGQIWAVADNGLYILSETGSILDYYGYKAQQPDHRFPFTSLRDIYTDQNDNCWLATNGDGLCKWNRKKNSFGFFDISSGFLSNIIYCIQEDNYDNLWLSTDFGLARFNKKTNFVKTYTEKDGLCSNEFNRSSQFKDQDGRIYFGGLNGITSFQPGDFANDTAMVNYPFQVSNCQWYNDAQQASENITGKLLNEKALVLNPEISLLSISFAMLNYENGLHHYAYKVEGLDNDWNYITENNIRLSHLPYGTYRLVIKAQTTNGYWNKAQIVIPLQVLTPYYKTWWFSLLLFVTGILLVGLLIYLRLQQQLRHLKKMNELRVKLASDLHDEVGGLLNKSAMQSELVKSQVSSEVKPVMDKIAANCREAMSSMRDIMWNLDSRNDSTEHLLDRIREYAQNMLNESYDYELDIRHMESQQIQPENRQTIYLIVKESINNILKHSRAGKVKISLYQSKGMVHLSIFNESPFIKNDTSTGQGIKNMQMRAEKVKGSFELKQENGVEILVKIPL